MTIPKPVITYFKRSCLVMLMIAGLAISYFRLLDNYELEFLDIRYHLRGVRKTLPEIALIEIGDDTFEKLGKWPIDRGFHAALLQALTDAGAHAVLFDIFFSEAKPQDAQMEKAMRNSGSVYLPFVLDLADAAKGSVREAKGYRADILKRFKAVSKRTGNISVVPDNDGKFRRVPIYVKYKDTYYPYLSFLLACDYLGVRQDEITFVPGKWISIPGRFKIPLDETSSMLVNFSAPWGFAFKHFSYVDILQSFYADSLGQKPILDLRIFKDMICVVGLTAAGTTDVHPTPMQSIYPGVGIQAEVLNGVLSGKFIMRLSRLNNLIVLIFLTVIISITTLKTRPFRGLIILSLLLAFIIAVSIMLFGIFGVWIDLFFPLIFMSILYLALTFRKYLAERQRRMFLEHELEIARTIQESFLPKVLPQTDQLEVFARMFTALHVGGDLYDCVDLADGKIGVMLGDVSGKGIPAALFMAKVISEFRFLVSGEPSPAKLLTKLNKKLSDESSSNLFVTVCYLIIDTRHHSVSYASGGHLPPVFVRGADGAIRMLASEEGMPLGLLEGDYSEDRVALTKGDTIILYTDGVTEAMDIKGAMYNEEKLVALIKKNKKESAEKLVTIIREDVRRFEGKAGQHDDTTILVIRMK